MPQASQFENNGAYFVGIFGGVVEDDGGFKKIVLRTADNPDAKGLEFSFKAFSPYDGEPTIEEGIAEGDRVVVRALLDVQLFEVGARAGKPTGEWRGFVKRQAIHVGPFGE